MKKVYLITIGCVCGVALIGGGIGIGWAIRDAKKVDTSNVPSWLQNDELRCDLRFYVKKPGDQRFETMTGIYDMWWNDSESSDSLAGSTVLMSFYNGGGIPQGSEFKFELTNFGSRFKDIHKTDLVDNGNETYMEYGILTPSSMSPVQSTMRQNIYWDGADADGNKGIKEIDILFECAVNYTVNQIGLAECYFNFL